MSMATVCTQMRQPSVRSHKEPPQPHLERGRAEIYKHVRDSARVNAWCRIMRDPVMGVFILS